MIFFLISKTNRELFDIVKELFQYFLEQMNMFSLVVEARDKRVFCFCS